MRKTSTLLLSPKKTCEAFGIESVAMLAQAAGKPPRTVQNWFNSEPALFQAILTGVAVQKLAAASGYDAHEALELLKLGIQVKQMPKKSLVIELFSS